MGGHSSGNYPPPSSGGGSLADNKVVWAVLGVVALVALIVILVAATSGGDESGGGSAETTTDDGSTPSGYTEEVEAAFVGSCSPSGGEATCQCAWDAIVEQMPFEDFAAMDQQIREDPTLATDPEALATTFPALQEIMAGCLGAA